MGFNRNREKHLVALPETNRVRARTDMVMNSRFYQGPGKEVMEGWNGWSKASIIIPDMQ